MGDTEGVLEVIGVVCGAVCKSLLVEKLVFGSCSWAWAWD